MRNIARICAQYCIRFSNQIIAIATRYSSYQANPCANARISAGDDGWAEEIVVVNESVQGASRTDIPVTLTLSGVTEDAWIVAMARGTDGVSEPLFLVLPASIDQGSNTTLDDLTDGNLGELGTPAFAFTNPLFINVNGDDWTAPGVANAVCSVSL